MKSHFKFTKRQRDGIFLLLIIVVVLQAISFYSDFKTEMPRVDSQKLLTLNKEWDSLRKVQSENNKPKIYPFNPNYIDDHKGYVLGMSQEEIDRLLIYREQDKWVNSASQFQQVTGVSDSLLSMISPYFKFPEWVTNPKSKPEFKAFEKSKPKSVLEKIDLNKGTSEQLQKVYGVGEKLAERIIKYRNKFDGGFISDVQLQDVYGLSPEVIERILNDFTVKTPRQIKKTPLNTATREQLVTVQYIDYEIAKNIIEARTLREGFKSLDELTKVKDFPVQKIEIIKLYLTLD